MLLSVEPEIYKNTSTWLPSNASSMIASGTGNPFLDLWGSWYYSIPQSTFPRDPNTSDGVSVADVTVMLHDLENTLGEIVAGMFWTLGNILPTSGPFDVSDGIITPNGTGVPFPTQIGAAQTPPAFLQGNAIVTEIQTRVRLDLSIIAITAGLTATIILALLSLPPVILNKTPQREIPIDGTGMLHAIWLYRNSPELETELEQVEHPTDENLRQAGMVRVRWADSGGGLRRRKSFSL
ncbi:hypothetical protein B0H16DRAFT_504567 [Mycena metata]|uniref:Uncharacterized protein n=1 Tax=Mycena metata TaxID=1033252 RepID=A0AAD7NIV8_9AGAR|nr:hypothetical protein B0H16DRAFT_504567 [Mycena metata]